VSNPRLLIATPLLGGPDNASVAYSYHVAVRQLERAGAVILPGELSFSDDIMRARSRCVWYALTRDTWDWLLFWDADNAPSDPGLVPRMIARADEDDHGWIGAAYPRKRLPPAIPYRPMLDQVRGGQIAIVRDCVEVEGIGLGFTLIRRSCLARMVEHYADELWFSDTNNPDCPEVVDVFNGHFTETTTRGGRRFREKLGEDYAACARWRAIGGKVQMFVGEGAPIYHVGAHRFTAAREDIGRLI
jgi:hypothetical protein